MSREKEQLEAFEALLVGRRYAELQENPIRGRYDVAHLKEMHRYLLQDLPDALPDEELWPYVEQPGEFRAPANLNHQKTIHQHLFKTPFI